MPLYRRSGSPHWQIRFAIDGKLVRVSSHTSDRAQASRLEAKLRAQYWQRARLPESCEHTVAELVQHWSTAQAGRPMVRERQILEAFSVWARARQVRALGPSDLADYARLIGSTMGPGGVNRHMATIKAIGKLALRLGWIDRPWQVPTIRQSPSERRWLSQEDGKRLLDALLPHARAMAEFALETGLRLGNITGLQWSWLDLERGVISVPAIRAKARRPITLPLSPRAITIALAQQGKHPDYVFTNQHGKAPVTSIKTHWATITASLGLGGLRFHDLRHSWASWHVLKGTPIKALKELGAWSDIRMVDRYAHLGVEDLRRYVA